MTPKRPASDVDRDVLVPKHRAQSPAVEFIDEECTGKYEAEELFAARRARAKADPASRIAMLEADQKQMGEDVNEIKLSIVRIEGDQKATNTSLSGIERSLERMAQREHVTFTARVDVEKAQALDVIDAKKTRRQLWLKAFGLVSLGGAIGKLLHWVGIF